MIEPQIAGETTIISSGAPAADASSSTAARSAMPPPPPPYSSGMLTPRKPFWPISSHISVILPPSRACFSTNSRPYLLASFLTASRRATRSSGSVKLIVISRFLRCRVVIGRG